MVNGTSGPLGRPWDRPSGGVAAPAIGRGVATLGTAGPAATLGTRPMAARADPPADARPTLSRPAPWGVALGLVWFRFASTLRARRGGYLASGPDHRR